MRHVPKKQLLLAPVHIPSALSVTNLSLPLSSCLALQDIREYELDYEAAKKAAAAVAIEAEKEEERRIKMLEKNPLGELPGFEEEEDFNFGNEHTKPC